MTGLTTAIGLSVGVGAAAFFSPCTYALVPAYLGFIATGCEGTDTDVTAYATRGVAAVVGVILAIAGLVPIAIVAGSTLQEVFPALEAGVGVALVVLGAITVWGLAPEFHRQLPARRRDHLGFVFFGGMYAIAAAGCVAPLFFALVVRSLTLSSVGVVGVFATFTATFGGLLLATTILVGLGWSAGSRYSTYLTRYSSTAGGAILLLAGFLQVWLVW